MDRDLLHSLLRLRETKSESCEILVKISPRFLFAFNPLFVKYLGGFSVASSPSFAGLEFRCTNDDLEKNIITVWLYQHITKVEVL